MRWLVHKRLQKFIVGDKTKCRLYVCRPRLGQSNTLDDADRLAYDSTNTFDFQCSAAISLVDVDLCGWGKW